MPTGKEVLKNNAFYKTYTRFFVSNSIFYFSLELLMVEKIFSLQVA